jgi:antitoxin ParD1/3/4
MNISLTPELREFVSKKVDSGLYKSASEVVREGLRLLVKHDRPSFRFDSVDELKAKLQEGIDQLDRGEGIQIDGQDELSNFFDDIKSSGRRRLESNG